MTARKRLALECALVLRSLGSHLPQQRGRSCAICHRRLHKPEGKFSPATAPFCHGHHTFQATGPLGYIGRRPDNSRRDLMKINASVTTNALNRALTGDVSNLCRDGMADETEASSNVKRQPVWPILVLACGLLASLTWGAVLSWAVVRMLGL
jgi:hypothetical protein